MEAADRIDPHEAKLLADILALVLADQPGPATAALEKLRQRANRDRITGGAIKAAFERALAGPAEGPHSVLFAAAGASGHAHATGHDQRLAELARQMLREAEAHRAALAAAAARESVLRTGLRRSWRRAGALAAALALLGLGAGFAAGRAWPDAGWPAMETASRIDVDPATLPPEPAANEAPSMPAEPAVLPADARDAIARHLLACGLLPERPGTPWFRSAFGRLAPRAGPPSPAYRLRVEARVDASGTVRGARIAAPPGVAQNDPAFHALAEPIGRRLLGPACAGLPIPRALLGQVRAVGLVLTP